MTQYSAEPWLVYDEKFINPDEPSGLWFCQSAEDAKSVGINACCLPITGTWDNLENCKDFISQFPYIFIPAVGAELDGLVAELSSRINYIPILVAEPAAFRGCKSVAEVRSKLGLKAVDHLLLGATELPAAGLIDISTVKRPDLRSMKRALSGVGELDKSIGGFYMGELSVWTAKRGEGKSTLLSQMLLESVAGGHKVCAYSGELPDWRFREWMYVQAAGPDHVTQYTDEATGKVFSVVPDKAQDSIDKWLAGRFFLYDLKQGSAHDEDSILQVFEYAQRRYGCDVFLVDNIMTARFKQGRDTDYFRAQSSFTGRLVEFAKKYSVHVHLVAHPRKTDNKRLDADDVGGAGDITNRADNVFALKRLDESEAEKEGFDCLLSVLKNRAWGGRENIKMNFDPVSRRFYKDQDGQYRQYPWVALDKQYDPHAPEVDPFDGR